MTYKEKIIYSLPFVIASRLKVPFPMILGGDYTRFRKMILDNNIDPLSYSLEKFSLIFEYAKVNFPFYTKLYSEAGVSDLKIKTLADIEKVPIITKSDIRDSLDSFSGNILNNTGGSSGEPFSFYIDKNAQAREWAHMHSIWELKDYRITDLKVTITGTDLGERIFGYHPTQNEFKYNAYKNSGINKTEILELFNKYRISYIHGYPSAIYNFLYELEKVLTPQEKVIIQKNIRACLFGSEFPTPNIVKYISTVWKFDYISWYGHSEKCILAYDLLKDNNYTPFYTYGFTEVAQHRLIGTSYHNFDMPLIRYDTGDIVSADYYSNGLIKSFKITEGRIGEFIIDRKDNKIPLTALIFGRHHDAFDFARYIQVRQIKAGEVIFYITTSETDLVKVENSLNLQNIDISFKVVILENPIVSKSGKIQLLVEEYESTGL